MLEANSVAGAKEAGIRHQETRAGYLVRNSPRQSWEPGGGIGQSRAAPGALGPQGLGATEPEADELMLCTLTTQGPLGNS